MRILFSLLTLLACNLLWAKEFKLESPDKKLTATISVTKIISWELRSGKEMLIHPSQILMLVNENQLWGGNPQVLGNKEGSVDEIIKPDYNIRAVIKDTYNYLVLSFDNYEVEFRLYNNGLAYRFLGVMDSTIKVSQELAEFNINENPNVWFAKTSEYQQPFEGTYLKYDFTDLTAGEFSITPVTIGKMDGYKMVITDANIDAYPGMFLEKTEKGFQGKFAPFVSKEKIQTPGKISPVKLPYFTKMIAKERENYLAETSGRRDFPWRLVIVEETEIDLMDNTLVYQLAPECKIKDPSWIKPGMVVWDWYHYWKIPGVDFKSGVNNETYRYYIDFAAENGFEYINVDFSWSPLLKLDKPKKKVNLPDIIEYAKSKDVGVFIWVMWYELDEKMEYYLDLFQSWGVDGLKVDFMDRDDQRVVEFYHRLAEETADRKLLVNLHGAYKPDGISRTWPNVINREGVIGLENNKFGNDATPEHNLTLPFTRNVVGPVDYTPGSMRHTTPEEYSKNWGKPHSMTTRCQQMAMYVVYYGPIQMLADAPTLYPEKVLSFLRQLPTVWDETIPIDAVVGEKAVIARKGRSKWFIGGMTASRGINQEISTDFLEEGKYRAQIWTDGEKLDDVDYSEIIIKKGDLLSIKMKPNGGTVIILEPEK